MTAPTPGAPLVDPPTGPPRPGPDVGTRFRRGRSAVVAAVVLGAGLVTWALVGTNRDEAPDAVATIESVASVEPTDDASTDDDLSDAEAVAPAPTTEPESSDPPATTVSASSTTPPPSATAAPAEESTVEESAVEDGAVEAASQEADGSAAGDEGDAADATVESDDVESGDAALEELQDLQDAADRLDDADSDDVVILSLPSEESPDVGALQPLTATIRGENVYLEGTAPSAAVGGDYERQAQEIWGDKVIARYAVDSDAPDPQADDVLLEKPVLFEPGSATIDPEYTPVLDACFEFLTTYPSVVMIVEGHTDDVGSKAYNLELAARRADAIVDYYESLGLQPDRLVTVSAGESAPLADNETVEGREQNRRIDLSLVGALVAAGDRSDDDAAAADADGPP